MTTPEDVALALKEARAIGALLTPFTDDQPQLDEAWGYRVQALDLAARLAAGERLIGAKLGLTSKAKQERMQVAVPIVGFLTDAMVRTPETVEVGHWAQPRIEPEIAFVTGRDLDGPVDLTDAAAAVSAVRMAAEIIDSRYAGYRFRLADVLADNTSAAGLLLGPDVDIDPTALRALPCRVSVDDAVVHTATGAAILGEPLLALVELAAHLGRSGQVLPAGSVVLAGALTDAVPLESGHRYRLEIEGLGALDVAA